MSSLVSSSSLLLSTRKAVKKYHNEDGEEGEDDLKVAVEMKKLRGVSYITRGRSAEKMMGDETKG